MKNPEIELDHIGVAVTSFEDVHPFWKALGWVTGETPETVSAQKVDVEMLPLKNAANVELLQPTGPDSTVAKFIAKKGPGIHHICFRVKHLTDLLEHLKKQGVRLINETPVSGAHGCQVAFVHPSSTGGVLVELSEKS